MTALVLVIIVGIIAYKLGFNNGVDDTIKRLKKVPIRKD